MDALTFWSDVALDLNKMDHSKAAKEQPGPCFSSRALAITYAALHDAYKAGNKLPRRYCYRGSASVGSPAVGRAAAGRAAYICLWHLYPSEANFLKAKYNQFIDDLKAAEAATTEAAWTEGFNHGNAAAAIILSSRIDDKSANASIPGYMSTGLPGAHNVDPDHPNQGFYGQRWGAVKPFVLSAEDIVKFRPPPPPSLLDQAYQDALIDVREVGDRKRRSFSNPDTLIGLFWAYDGAINIGTPPRLYNQILMTFAEHEGYSETERFELFALANLAMGDAAIQAWDTKYYYNFWRPVLGVRHDPASTGWKPQGAPNSNNFLDTDATPNFPAYTSGHATFGAACFTVLKSFRSALGKSETCNIELRSEETDPNTTDHDGTPRPSFTRTFTNIDAMIDENARSRTFLGVHWRFDATEGVKAGKQVGNKVYKSALS